MELKAIRAFAEGGFERNELVAFDSIEPDRDLERLSTLGIDPGSVKIVNIKQALDEALRGNFDLRARQRNELMEEARREGKYGVRLMASFGYGLYERGKVSLALKNERLAEMARGTMTRLCALPAFKLDSKKGSDSRFLIRLIKYHKDIFFPGIVISRT